ncbi:hypothetical protein J3F83DRAFT_115345 [Trichoderma novae-zelandiae]
MSNIAVYHGLVVTILWANISNLIPGANCFIGRVNLLPFFSSIFFIVYMRMTGDRMERKQRIRARLMGWSQLAAKGGEAGHELGMDGTGVSVERGVRYVMWFCSYTTSNLRYAHAQTNTLQLRYSKEGKFDDSDSEKSMMFVLPICVN